MVVKAPLREEAQLSVVVRRWASLSLVSLSFFADPVVVNLALPQSPFHFLPSSSFLPPNSGRLGVGALVVQAC